jgi:hypothetical protein
LLRQPVRGRDVAPLVTTVETIGSAGSREL